MKIKNSAAIYFALQGFGVVAWWIMLVLAPTTRRYFQLEAGSEKSLTAFWLADLGLLAIGSFAASQLCWRESKHAPAALWFVVGAITYATGYCLAFALITDNGWLGVVLMSAATVWSGNFAIALSSFREQMFRAAEKTSTNWILLKTFTQIIVVWTLILLIIPYFITVLEDKLGIARFEFPFQKPLAALMFIAISTIGLSSAYTMSRSGKGTPLPLDAATNLVISGVYAYVRNPMAISGIGQGLAVALWLGSPIVAIYAITGALIWQVIFRPLEEDYLTANFGADYEDYRRQVKCWIPNFKAYKSA